MKLKKLLIPLISVGLLSGCWFDDIFNANPSDPENGAGQSEHNYDVDPTTDIDVDVDTDGNDYDALYVAESEITPPEIYDEFTDNIITTGGKYYLSGNYDSIKVTADKNSEVYLFLDGVTISNEIAYAFGSDKQITTYLVVLNNSVNSFKTTASETNAIHFKGDLHIQGQGTISADGAKSGLKASKDLYISGSGLTINSKGVSHGISARSVMAYKSTINVETGEKDGIQAEVDTDVTTFTTAQGYVYLYDVNYTANVKGDGIQADTYVYIRGGNLNITAKTTFTGYSDKDKYEDLTDDDFKFKKSGSEYIRIASDDQTSLSNRYALINSCKGVKAGIVAEDTTGSYDIYIAHLAKLKIDSFDDGIHTNYGNVNLNSANIEIDTLDDGIHADKTLNIQTASIQINDSYEGLEGGDVVIDGAQSNIVVISDDDGINAASDISGPTKTITINNGYLRVYAAGDGVDANASIYFNGGTTIVEGPGRNNGSIDSDRGAYFKGGIVFACSTNGMRETMTATQNTFIYQGSTMNANSVIDILDSNKTSLFQYTLKQSCNQIVFSHPSLELQKSYTIKSGSSTITTIKMTSSLTTVGTSGGGGGWPRP